jgi:hypothetical protein
MLNLENVQLLCVNGSVKTPNDAVAAMQLCMSQAKFGNATLIGEFAGRNMEGIERHHVRGNLQWYNQFMVSGVVKFLTHDYVLVVQHDGMIVNPSAWSDEFFNYDYIGAPWPVNRPQPCRVGNGGFSLRSRRLQQELAKMPFPCKENEDAFICDRYRRWLEDRGMRFAPPELAAQFSVEFHTWHHDDYGKIPFGFHGWYDGRDRKYLELRNKFK